MSSIRKILFACTAGVVLLLVVYFAERHFLNAAEERGRKRGLAIQAAEDQRATDYALAVAAMRTQAALDSVERADSMKFAVTDTGFARVLVKYRDRIVHDTVVAEIVASAKADVAACTENVLSCAAARANAERDAARARLTVADRDTTILRMAHQTIPPPRSCVPQTVAGGLVGAALAIMLHR